MSWKGVCENCFSVGLQTAAVAGCAVHGEMEAFGNGHEKDTVKYVKNGLRPIISQDET